MAANSRSRRASTAGKETRPDTSLHHQFFAAAGGLLISFFFLKYSRFANLIAWRLRRCKFRLAF
jgi:hypothetical protein